MNPHQTLFAAARRENEVVDELLTAIENREQDIGGSRSTGDIIKDLGPAYDALKKVLTLQETSMPNQPKRRNRVRLPERLTIEYFPCVDKTGERNGDWAVRIVGGNGEVMMTSESYNGRGARGNAKRAAMNLSNLIDPNVPDLVVREMDTKVTR